MGGRAVTDRFDWQLQKQFKVKDIFSRLVNPVTAEDRKRDSVRAVTPPYRKSVTDYAPFSGYTAYLVGKEGQIISTSRGAEHTSYKSEGFYVVRSGLTFSSENRQFSFL